MDQPTQNIPASTNPQAHYPFQGILFMVLGIGALTSMDALAKTLVQQGINPLQILGLRLFIVVPVIFGFYAFTGRLRELMPTRMRFQVIRGCIGFLAPFCFFMSLKFCHCRMPSLLLTVQS